MFIDSFYASLSFNLTYSEAVIYINYVIIFKMIYLPVLRILVKSCRRALRSLVPEIAETNKVNNPDYSHPKVSPFPSLIPSILALIASST